MKFRKKPVVIDAVKWTGNPNEILEVFPDLAGNKQFRMAGYELFVDTLEGTLSAQLGDWIIRGVKGEFYPIKNDIFLETYEEVLDAAR